MPLDPAETREAPFTQFYHAPVPARSRRRALIWTAVGLGLVIAVFVGYHFMTQQAIKAFMAQPLPPTPITAAVAESRSVPKFLSGIGTLQAVHQVTVAPEVGGRVTQIFFEPGATVNAGDPLIQLN